MNKADIIDRVASGTGLTKIETEAVVDGFMTSVIEAVKEGDHVELRGFGVFRPRHRAARPGRNPQTGETIHIEARYVPVFKAARGFRDAVQEALPEENIDND